MLKCTQCTNPLTTFGDKNKPLKSDLHFINSGNQEFNKQMVCVMGFLTKSSNKLPLLMETFIFFCFNICRPPSGCLQWLIDREGTFQSFNFASGNGHLVNQDYSVCIRQETGKKYHLVYIST